MAASLLNQRPSNAGDEAVMATNDDASNCKRFAVQLGYWPDKYIPLFVRSAERKAPEINRGYFARVQAILQIARGFIRVCGVRCQIINLGAGFDTLYWRLKDENLSIKNFVEFDFPHIASRKCHHIKNTRALLEKLAQPDVGVSELHSADYHLVSADLRNTQLFEQKLMECGVDVDCPTLFIAECVLVYMNTASSCSLLRSISSKFSTCAFVNYEQVNMRDRFGEVMLDNLNARGCSLSGISDCISLDTQEKRFVDNGWEGATAINMMHVYHSLPKSELLRVEKIEFLDEVGLLEQLLQHYCICFAWKDSSNFNLRTLFRA